MNTKGNRKLNHAIHIVAITQIRSPRSAGHAYYRRKLDEGKTEKAFKPHLIAFLQTRLAGKMPKLDFVPYDGRIPTGGKLKRVVGYWGGG